MSEQKVVIVTGGGRGIGAATAKLFAQRGYAVCVNCVRPGLIYTDMHTDGGEPARVERLKGKIPMQRGGTAEEVAEAIYWLASDHSSFATGNFVDVTGGL